MNIKLRAARAMSGKTQVQVAKEAGITERGYQRYEYGERVPDACTASTIATILGSTVEAIWGNSNNSV